MPRCAEFRENSRRSVCLPACRGRWATLAWLGGGVRSDDVGDYRTMAFIKSIAFTPSVMGFWPMTASPTQGSLFLCPGRRSVDFCCSGIVTQRAGRAAAPTRPNRASFKKFSASRVSAGACVFRLLPDFGRMSPFPGNFLSPFPGMTIEDSWGSENGPLQKRNSYCRLPSYTVTHERSQ